MIHLAYLLLGANLGDRAHTLQQAVARLAKRTGTIRQLSPIYETAPWGLTDQPAFLNQVVAIETTQPAEVLLGQMQAIELALGRVRHEHWGARTIDIDLLYYDDLVQQTPTLTLPHPYLHERRFTLVPLADVAPDYRHPILGKTTTELLAGCPDAGAVTIFNSPTIRPPH